MLRVNQPHVSNRKGRQEGQAAVELAGLAPVIIAIVLVMLQGISIMFAASHVRGAARDGARSLERGESVVRAVSASLPDSVKLRKIDRCGKECVEVTAQVPIGVPGFFEFGRFTIKDKATFRLRRDA